MRGRPKRLNGAPTMADVAALSQVSINTVSLALRQPTRVAPATRTRIHEAIEQLGYTPNLLAGALVTKRTNIIGVVIPSINYTSLWDIVSALTDVFDENGYQILMGMTKYSLEREARIVQTFLTYRPAGMVLTGLMHLDQVHESLAKVDFPVAEILRVGPNPIDICVGFSHEKAMRTLVDLLVDGGRKKLAYVRTPHFEASDREGERVAAFISEVAKRGLRNDLLFEAPSTIGGGTAVIDEILNHDAKIDGVIFGTHLPALGSLIHCQQKGITVPGQIALAAFGSPTDGTASIEPGLTTIQTDHRDIGHTSAHAILGRLSGQPAAGPTVIELPFKLIRRGSA